jgi:hypothetical protein
MVQPFYNAPPTTNQINPWNNMLSRALERYNAMTMSKYLPQQQEADIFHKRISPLANIAISPLFAGLEPQAQQQISDYISHALNPGGTRQQRSPVDALKSLFGGNNQPQNMPNPPQERPTTSLRHNIVEQLNARKAAPGSTIVNPEGNPISSIPTAATTEDTQATLTAYQELEPRLHVLANMSKKFPGDWTTKFNVAKDKITSGSLADKYAAFKALQKEVKPFFKKLGLSDADAEEVLRVHHGEKDYSGRILAYLRRLQESTNRSKKREGGISLESSTPSKANKISSQINLRKLSDDDLRRMLAEASS